MAAGSCRGAGLCGILTQTGESDVLAEWLRMRQKGEGKYCKVAMAACSGCVIRWLPRAGYAKSETLLVNARKIPFVEAVGCPVVNAPHVPPVVRLIGGLLRSDKLKPSTGEGCAG